MMSVQGPLTRSVADARLALQERAQGNPLGPEWVPAPRTCPQDGWLLRAAVFKRRPALDADPTVETAVEQAAAWLAAAGCEIEQVEPRTSGSARSCGPTGARRAAPQRPSGQAAIETMSDADTISVLHGYLHGLTPLDGDQTREALTRRFDLCRD